MSEMVDRALRAWLETAHQQTPNVLLFDELGEYRDELRICMRAAIAALREPTDDIEYVCGRGNEEYTGCEVWQSAIDEALK